MFHGIPYIQDILPRTCHRNFSEDEIETKRIFHHKIHAALQAAFHQDDPN
jgi:hypothetical protein